MDDGVRTGSKKLDYQIMNFGGEDFAKLIELVKYIWASDSSGIDTVVIDNQSSPFILEEGLSFIVTHVGGDILDGVVCNWVKVK